MAELDINGLPLAATVNSGDFLVKWDATQVSGQRTQKFTAAQFRAYIVSIIPAGPAGATGPATTLYAGTTTTLAPGSAATVSVTGAAPQQYLNLGIPQGAPGPANQLTVGNVSGGATAAVTIRGTAPSQAIDFVLPQGPNGTPASFSSVSATTLAPGSQATATLGGTGPSNYTITFGLPQGQPGTGNGNVNTKAGSSITNNAVVLYDGTDTTGNTVKPGGVIAAIATSGSAADLSTGTLPAGRFPALTGDITTTAGALGTTLATSGVTAGSYTLPTVTFDAKGRATAASSATTTGTGSVVLAASPALTGTPTAPTPATADNSTTMSTTAFVKAQGYAPLASPAFTGTPTVPTAAAGTSTTQAASTAFVATSYAPLASPAFTGTPTVPTAATGTNTTQAASTAFVLANSGGGAPSTVNAQSSTYTAVAGDKGKTLVLSGSATLTLGAGTAVAGWYVWVKKTDGSGVWAITPASGSIDGLSTINLYQESYLIWYDAAASVYRTQGRPKGWVSISAATVSAVSNVTLTTGFGDTELRDLHVSAENCVPSASDSLVSRVQKAGATVTSGYSGSQVFFDGTNSGIAGSAAGAVYAMPANTTSPQNAEIDLGNINTASVTGGQPIVSMGNSPGAKQFINVLATSTTSGATTGVVLLFIGGSTLSGNISLRGYRP
jgi:hypothetical protein